MTKQDFYQDCYVIDFPKEGKRKLSVQELHDFACHKCLNPECSRSISGTSRFEQRAVNWEQRLFVNPDRLDPQDPLFKGLTAKRFLNVVPPELGRQASWDDPRDLPTTSVSVPETVSPPLIELPEIEPEVITPPKEYAAKVEPPAPPPAPVPAPVVQPPLQKSSGNTPNRSRQMVGGIELKEAPLVLDPWQPKQTLNPGETLVSPGAKIKLGGK